MTDASLLDTDPASAAAAEPVLALDDLACAFPGEDGPVTVVHGVSLAVAPGRTLAVVGESGSGKTMTFLAALGLMPKGGRVVRGSVRLQGQDLLKLGPEALRRVRGADIAMVFQDPLTGLNPVFTIGDQLVEVLRAHRPISRSQARREAIDLLDRVHIPDPKRRAAAYPHQLSGGMRQRVLIAMAISLGPKVLIADEPTTALDVTVQAQILELLEELQAESGMGLVLITHDLGLVARHADDVAVMYAGRVVEEGDCGAVFARTRHPYTAALFRSIPNLEGDAAADLLAIEGQPPDPARLPTGCAFEPRCWLGQGRTRCAAERPALVRADEAGHRSACWFALEVHR